MVYLRVVSENGVSCNFLAAKTRVPPLVKQTIPRLELLGAFILSRLGKTVREKLSSEFTINREIYLTDSEIALYWIKSKSNKYPPFLENKRKEISQNTSISDWYHIRTEYHIAELASRGCDLMILSAEKKWFSGPDWLLSNIEVWTLSAEKFPDQEVIKEMASVKSKKSSDHCLVANCKEQSKIDLRNIIKPEKFSDIQKLFRVTALVIKFIQSNSVSHQVYQAV